MWQHCEQLKVNDHFRNRNESSKGFDNIVVQESFFLGGNKWKWKSAELSNAGKCAVGFRFMQNDKTDFVTLKKKKVIISMAITAIVNNNNNNNDDDDGGGW